MVGHDPRRAGHREISRDLVRERVACRFCTVSVGVNPARSQGAGVRGRCFQISVNKMARVSVPFTATLLRTMTWVGWPE